MVTAADDRYSISPAGKALGSKPAAAACDEQMTKQTDGRTDGRPTVSQTLLRIICEQYQ